MKIKYLIASILLGAILSRNSIECVAQNNSRLGFGAYSTSLFRDSGSDKFFDGQMFQFAYQFDLAPNIGGTIGLNTLSAMNTNNSFGGLSRYLFNHTEIITGATLTIINLEKQDVAFVIGPTVRNRKEVEHNLSIESELGDLTLDEYHNSWDVGFLLKLELSRIFKNRYYISLGSGITTYSNEESVLHAGLGISIKL